MSKNERLEIRLKEEDKWKVKELAAKHNLNTSEFVLYCILKVIAEEELK